MPKEKSGYYVTSNDGYFHESTALSPEQAIHSAVVVFLVDRGINLEFEVASFDEKYRGTYEAKIAVQLESVSIKLIYGGE